MVFHAIYSFYVFWTIPKCWLMLLGCIAWHFYTIGGSSMEPMWTSAWISATVLLKEACWSVTPTQPKMLGRTSASRQTRSEPSLAEKQGFSLPVSSNYVMLQILLWVFAPLYQEPSKLCVFKNQIDFNVLYHLLYPFLIFGKYLLCRINCKSALGDVFLCSYNDWDSLTRW